MAIANCKRCGQMFNQTSRVICPDCIAEEEEAFQLVRAYLKQNREANLQQVVSETGINEAFILDMIYQGRLYLGDNPNMSCPCERCGQDTTSGRYCTTCAVEMESAFQSAQLNLEEKRRAARNGFGYHSR